MSAEDGSKAVRVGREMLAGDENELITPEYPRHEITRGKKNCAESRSHVVHI